MNNFLFLKKYTALFESDEKPQNRKSVLEPMLLAASREHPLSSLADLTELIFGDRYRKRSSLDKPIKNLIEIGLVEAVINEGAKRKKGEGSQHYKLTQKGMTFFK